MNNKVINILLIALFAISLTFCASEEKKEEPAPTPPPAKQTDDSAEKDAKMKNMRAMEVDPSEEVNDKLKTYRYPNSPSKPGFDYKGAEVGKEDFGTWAKANVSLIKESLDKLPADYSLEITGHTDSTGPENPEGKKKGNIYYSEKRASAVKDALVKQGIPANRITVKGAGSSQPIPGIDGSDAKNRRVTFMVVKVEQKEDKQKAAPPKKEAPPAEKKSEQPAENEKKPDAPPASDKKTEESGEKKSDTPPASDKKTDTQPQTTSDKKDEAPANK
ncbi:MAG: OmpA family protein [Leptospira sp.]|nr:OmpA family protein [Leptospira sp.]